MKPRSITTYTPAFRSRQQQWIVPSFQRRFVTEDATKSETATAATENFAQTAAEAPVEEDLTPAQEAAQAPPTDSSATVGADALHAAAQGKSQGDRKPSRFGSSPAPPNKTVYVGNLYYEVTEDQLKRVFSRFGAIESVNVVFDNRGLSRGYDTLPTI